MPKIKKEFSRYDLFIVDIDGVVWRGNEVIVSNIQSLNILIEQGKSVIFMTNNSTRDRLSYLIRLRDSGISIKSVGCILTSAYATALFLRKRNITKVYVVGEPGLVSELLAQGIRVVNEDDCMKEGVEAVVVGLDRNLTYRKLMCASAAIKNGALFIATNTDKTLPLPDGEVPGAGSIVSAISTATGREPDYIIGKPNTFMLELALGREYDKSKVLVIGDRLDTDVEFAYNCGVDSAIVLTGVTEPDDITRYPHKPTYVLRALEDMLL